MERHEIETIVLGMAMLEKHNLAEAISRSLQVKHFADEFHARVFGAMVGLWEDGQEADTVSIANTVGRGYLPQLSAIRNAAPFTQNFAPYVTALLDAKRSTELMEQLLEFGRRLTQRGALEPLAPIIDRIGDLVSFGTGSGPALKTTTIKDALGRSLAAVERRIVANQSGEPPGIPSGFPGIDHVIYGFQPGFIYVLGARTAVGKTTMALNMALAAATAGHKTAFVTVEMSDEDLTDKMLTRLSLVNIGRYLAGSITQDEVDRLMRGATDVASLPILFTEVAKPEFDYLAFEIMRLVKVEKVKLVVIDYLQLFEVGDGRFRPAREEAKIVSARLKSLARSLKVPILVLSQLNRQAPEDGEPELIHIAESDQIARDADYVLFLYRWNDQYYLSVAKNRRGPKKAMRLHAELQHALFRSAEVAGGR